MPSLLADDGAVDDLRSVPEGELIRLAQLDLPAAVRERLDYLWPRLDEETILPEELAEYRSLMACVELRQAQRVAYLAELSCRRGIPLLTVMRDLGLQPHSYD